MAVMGIVLLPFDFYSSIALERQVARVNPLRYQDAELGATQREMDSVDKLQKAYADRHAFHDATGETLKKAVGV